MMADSSMALPRISWRAVLSRGKRVRRQRLWRQLRRARRLPPVTPLPPRPNRHLAMVWLVSGLVLMAMGFYPFHLAVKSNAWPYVEGRILTSALDHTPWSPFYRTLVSYQYQIQGQTYVGRQVEFGMADQYFLLKEFAQRITQRYPANKDVWIFINPLQPHEAVLERTPSMGGSMLLIVFGMSAMAIWYIRYQA